MTRHAQVQVVSEQGLIRTVLTTTSAFFTVFALAGAGVPTVTLSALPVAHATGAASAPGHAPRVHVAPAQPARSGAGHATLRRPAPVGRAATGSAPTAPAVGGSWTALGPQPISGIFGSAPSGGSSGRVTGLAVAPGTGGQTVFAATAGGGVWKTTDGGTTWAPTGDSQSTLAIGSITAFDAGTVYAGTGEANNCGDCQAGQGVLKSIDGGATWTMLGGATFNGLSIGSIAVDRTNPNNVLAAAGTYSQNPATSLYYSADGGATWHAAPGVTGAANVVLQDPANAGLWYVATADDCLALGSGGKVFHASSPFSGASWTAFGGFPANQSTPRLSMGVGYQSVPGKTVFYVAVSACGAAFGSLSAVDVSADSGITWTPNAVTGICPTNGTGSGPLCDPFTFQGTTQSQGWYDNVVAVDPGNPVNAVIGGIELIATTDEAHTWTDINQPYTGGAVHSDTHAFGFWAGAKTPGALYVGNDGGVWKTAGTQFGGAFNGTGGAAVNWADLNNTLSITQLYSGNAQSASLFFGGSQDNGTLGQWPGSPATPPSRQEICGGDGGFTAVDQATSTLYCEFAGGFISRTSYASPGTITDLGYNAAIGAQPTAFITPFVIDPATRTTLYTGAAGIWRAISAETTPAWTQIHPDITTGSLILGPPGDFVSAVTDVGNGAGTALAEASYTGNFYWTADATAGSPAWNQIGGYQAGTTNPIGTSNLPMATSDLYAEWLLNEPWVESIAINPTNPNEVWVALGASVGGSVTSRLWHTTNANAGSVSWAPIDGAGANQLPLGLVTTSIAFDATRNLLLLGTSAGAYMCSACSGGSPTAAWAPLGTGLPSVRVDSIQESADGARVFVFTHGRGIWSLPPPNRLVFTTQPGGGAGATPWAQQPVVAIQDANGVTQVGAPPTPITLSISTNPGGGALTCVPNPATSASGVATFAGCQIDKAASGYVLTASSATDVAGTSSPFNITVGSATQLGFITSPGSAVRGTAFGQQAAVAVEDAGGNTVPSASDAITLSMGTNPSGGTLSGCTPNPLNASAGVATFAGCKINKWGVGYTLTATASGLAAATSSAFDVVAGAVYTSFAPTRICDTRGGAPQCGVGRLGPGGVINVGVVGNWGGGAVVPANATAVVLNVTAVDMHGAPSSYLTVYPAGSARPSASNLNFAAGVNLPNLVTVQVGALGLVTIYNNLGNLDVVVDLSGYYAPPLGNNSLGHFVPIAPSRYCDTRGGAPQCAGQRLGPGGSLNVTVTGGAASIPGSATAVVLNATVVSPSGAPGSFLSVYPAGAALPNVSNLNFFSGQTIANRVIVQVGSGGQITITNNSGSVDVVIDINGYYLAGGGAVTAGSFYVSLPPTRICDTRGGAPQCGGRLGPSSQITVAIAGFGGVPGVGTPNAPTGVVANLTAVDLHNSPALVSYLAAYPDFQATPTTSDVNFPQGTNLPNLIVVKLSVTASSIQIYNSLGDVDVIVDVAGYFTSA